jgi:hypothetical protein
MSQQRWSEIGRRRAILAGLGAGFCFDMLVSTVGAALLQN